jgi:hypothetical protein
MLYRTRLALESPLFMSGCALAASLSAAPALAQQATAAPPLQAQRIVIDATTGRPRMAEHDEVNASKAAAAQRAAAPAAAGSSSTGIETHPALQRMQAAPMNPGMGAIGRRFDAKTLQFTVARRAADGTVSTQCVTGEQAATIARNSDATGAKHDD